MARLTDEAIDRMSQEVAQIMADLSDDVVGVICRRLKATGELSASDVSRLTRLAETGDMSEIADLIALHLGRTADAVDDIFHRIADYNDEWAGVYYKAAGMDYAGWQSSQITTALVAQATKSTRDYIVQMVDTAAFRYGGNVHTIRSAYVDAINRGITAVSTGVGDYTTVIRDTVKQLSQSGLREVEYKAGSTAERLANQGILSVKYPSGRTLRIDSAARMNIMDGFRGTMGQIREQQGREFGADGYEISAHGLCAPDHQRIQGKRYTFAAYEKLNDGLERPIGKYNCKHTISPVIMGVSERAYSKEQLAEMSDYSTAEVTYTGIDGKQRTATRYEATQYQRSLETALRTKKSESRALAEAGDTTGARQATTEARALQSRYRDVSDEMGLQTRPYRTR